MMSEHAQTTSEILRKRSLYQKSYTGPAPTPTRSTSPLVLGRVKGQTKQKKKRTFIPSPNRKAKTKSLDGTRLNPSSNKPLDKLDYRRRTRSERPKPWAEKLPNAPKLKYGVRIFYDKYLPAYVDESKVSISTRQYVSNTKYGNIYRIQQDKPRKKEKTPPPQKWLWEDEFKIWLNGTRDKYLSDTSNRLKPVKVGILHTSGDMTSQSSRSGSLPSLDGTKKGHRPTANVYAQYNYHRLEKSKRQEAVIVLQRFFKGWYVRNTLKKLKRKALLQHGRLWPNFIHDYRDLVTRIQLRYGNTKPSCRTDLGEIKTFMDRKLAYEKAFVLLAKGGKLPRDSLMEFFNRCDLWPTQGDINRAFGAIFKDRRNAAEVVFVLDCSSNAGVIAFHNSIQFVKDMVTNLDIAPDRTRVGMIQYNESVLDSFGITDHDNKQDVLDAIGKTKLQHGPTKTDVALRAMRDMFKSSRPGVKKVGIVISGCRSKIPENTRREAGTSKDNGIELITLNTGEDSLGEMVAVASSSDHVYRSLDAKSLTSIKHHIEKRFCLVACGFCQRLLPRLYQYGVTKGEAMEIGWALFPPLASAIRPSDYLHIYPLDLTLSDRPVHSDTIHHFSRPLEKSESLEVVFTCYPPEACGVEHAHFSRWIRPIVNDKEAWALMDDDIIKKTGMKTCLQLVIQARLRRHGYVTVPSDVREGIEKVTNEEQAMEIVEQFIKDRMTLNIDKDLKTVAELKIKEK